MLKKGLKVISFLLIVVLVWGHLTMKFRAEGLHPVYREPNDTMDVVMVGSSAWYTFWAPMVAYENAGITSFDYAQGGMPADFIEYCIREIVKNQSPKVVAIDARVFQYRDTNTIVESEDGGYYIPDNYVRTIADTMPNSWNRFQMLNSVSGYLEDGWYNYLDLLFYHGRWKELLTQGGSSLYADEVRDFTKGFDWHGEVNVYPNPGNFAGVTDQTALSEDTTRLLRELCEYCEEQDFQTVFVVIPIANMSEEQQKQYNYIRQIVSEYDGIDFINANDYIEAIGIDYASDFYAETHGNYSGAVKFTHYFSDYLLERYGLPDRRGQDGYEFWQEDYEKWQQFLGYVL